MSIECKKLVLINGSPKIKAEESLSEKLIHLLEDRMSDTHIDALEDRRPDSQIDVYKINARESLKKGRTYEDFNRMLQADAIVFVFPLYIFCLPGVMMRFLQDFYSFFKQSNGWSKKLRLYAIVNCGFPEAYINEEAVGVIQSFGRQTGADFGFGVMIGGGGMVVSTLELPIMRKTKGDLEKAFDLITGDILSEEHEPMEPISLELKFNHRLYYYAGNRGWYASAKKYGLKKKDLYRRPYLQE